MVTRCSSTSFLTNLAGEAFFCFTKTMHRTSLALFINEWRVALSLCLGADPSPARTAMAESAFMVSLVCQDAVLVCDPPMRILPNLVK